MTDLNRRDVLKAGLGGVLSLSVVSQLKAADKPDPYADAVLVDGELPAITPGSFTIVVLPDIQNYTDTRPQIALAQTRWILENAQARNIVFACQLGDLTNHNLPEEYKNAAAALNALDGTVSYSFVTGNHDYGKGGKCQDRSTNMPDFFPKSNFEKSPAFGGTYDKEPDVMTNSFHRFEAMGRKFLVLALEFGPRHDVVRWANDIVSKHHNHEVILTTHSYMEPDDRRDDWSTYGDEQKWNPHRYGVAKVTDHDVMDGEQLWKNLVSKHENFIMTLNGHVLEDGLGRLTSQTPDGRDVQQMVVNFQMRPNGGDGWLRTIEFLPDGKSIRIADFSPTRHQKNESAQNRFELTTSSIG